MHVFEGFVSPAVSNSAFTQSSYPPPTIYFRLFIVIRV